MSTPENTTNTSNTTDTQTETVIREVTPGVWTFSRPFARFGVWPIGGRSTAILLSCPLSPPTSNTSSSPTPSSSTSSPTSPSNPSSPTSPPSLSPTSPNNPSNASAGASPETNEHGAQREGVGENGSNGKKPLWLLASTPLDAPTKKKLDELGEVRYIVGADEVHHLYLGDYKRAWPGARLVAPISVVERHRQGEDGEELVLDGAWGRDPPGTKYGFEDEIEHCYFPGYKNHDVAFLHKPSRTLLQADLVMNLSSLSEQYSSAHTKESSKILGVGVGFAPTSLTQAGFVWGLGVDAGAMRRDAATVAAWDFERIIPCHGDVIETGGKDVWRKAFRWFLD